MTRAQAQALLVFLLLLGSADALAAGKKPAKKPPKKPAAAAAKKRPRSVPPSNPKLVERLGRGYRLYIDGDYPAARAELLPLASATLFNRDYALYLLAQAELLDDHAQEAAGHFAELEKLPGRFQRLARFRRADALYALHQLDEARRLYETGTGRDDLVDVGVAYFRIAESHEKLRKPEAVAAYRKLYIGRPSHPLADLALERLNDLGGAALTASEHVTRARNLLGERSWSRAIDELRAIPDAELAPALRAEVQYWLGTALFKTRHHYEEASQRLLAVWSQLPGDDRRADALFYGTRALSRIDRDEEALAGYRDVVLKFPGTRLAAEAQFLCGWLEFNRGRYSKALQPLSDTIDRYGKTSYAIEARWYSGFARWMLGDFEGALRDLEKLASNGGALVGGKGAYWRGRALDKLGRKSEAQQVWRDLAWQYPFTFYAQLARLRLKEAGIEIAPLPDGKTRAFSLLAAVDEKLAEEPLVRRVDELLAAGLSVEAGFELRVGEGELLRRLGSARALPLLFDRYERAENFQRPHRLGETYAGAALRNDPQQPEARAWWQHVYPLAYRSLVEKYAPTGDNPPYYLYTIMQKESAYNPHDVSYADAIGLLQMIPPTSRRVASKIDFPYTDDVLYDPEGNIRFGAWYIGHLLAKFKGQVALGAGSFNAGPKAMMRWLKQYGDRPLDELIELNPYTQTREYMKKVLDIYAHYLFLYEKQDYLPSLKVDREWLDDSIDY